MTTETRKQPARLRRLAAVLLILGLSTCAENPVTGDREFTMVSERQEIALGQENYRPTQQSQGGQWQIDRELTAYVSEVGQRVAEQSPRQLPYEFVVLNSSVPNAWALPGGKIAINRGLLTELNNEAELAAVLGHEVVHSAARHGAQSMERGMLLQGALMVTSIAAQNNEYAGFIVGGAQLGAQLISTRYGRDAEREGDLYGTRYMAEAGYDPAAAVSLQEAFVRLSEGNAPGWLDGLFASHPASTERVQNNRELAAQLRAEGYTDGELGEQRYQQRTARLRETQPAYEAFDEAYALLRDDKVEEAEQKLDTAIRMVPQEARFYGLKADIALMQRRYGAAIETYNQALARDDAYFDYYLGRGLAYSRQGNDSRARADLQASVDLLPTALAMNELGTMALAANDRGVAKQYFQQAAAAPGELGAQAQASYIRLDVADNPGAYVQAQAFVGSGGQIQLRVVNRAPVDLRNIELELQASVGREGVRRAVSVGSLASGQARDVASGLTLPAETDPQTVQAQVLVRGASVN
ncbi:MAG: M48 family metalloprotease [Pseudohongiella sp.]|uniref:M48 family metalloprotease n=1 Tax=Pseudohongiella sp. TaxID=1979412 RepID=UPI0034A06385